VAYILHIDTSSNICSVALSQGEQLIFCIEDEKVNSHASKLTSIIDEVLEKSKLEYNKLDAISFSSGPGSYTGLRIGLSTAKGICYALNIPLIFTNSLEALADEMIKAYEDKNGIYCPMIDARRMEVYTMQVDIHKNILLPIQPFILSESSLNKEDENKKYIVAGSGKKKAQYLLSNKNIMYLDIENNSAKYLIKNAYIKYLKKQFENTAYCEPYYLKNPLIK
jgi:tRNA threonylcarbamoyladenosine biosynthesis protein TsaB